MEAQEKCSYFQLKTIEKKLKPKQKQKLLSNVTERMRSISRCLNFL